MNCINNVRLFLASFVTGLFVLFPQWASSTPDDADKAGAVAVEFINAYVKAIPGFDGYLGAVDWVKNHPLASDDFKQRLEALYRKSLEDDPEMGYGADAVLSAQDYPDAYAVESVHITGEKAVVGLRGVAPVSANLRVILIRAGDSWLVDASGDLAEEEQIKP